MTFLLAGATLIFLIIFSLDLYPGLRGGAGWDWLYALPDSPNGVILLIIALIVYLIGAWIVRRHTKQTLLWALIGSCVITFAVVGVRGDPGFLLFTRTVSPVQTGGSAIATRIIADEGASAALRRWPMIMQEAEAANLIHFTTSPPGQALFHYWAANVFDHPLFTGIRAPLSDQWRAYQCSDIQVMRYTDAEILSAGLGLFMPFLAALGLFPVFWATRLLTDDPHQARRVTLWWALIPTIALFAPTWNTVYPALCALAFALLVYGLRRDQIPAILAAGAVMSITTFLNFAVLPVLFLFGVFTLGDWYTRRTHPFISTVIAGIWFAIGLLSIWIAFLLYTGLTPFDLWQVSLASHRDLVQRDYAAWLILHPYDLFLFMGFPLIALSLWSLAIALWRRGETAIDVLTIALWVTILIVNVIGIVQGENGRILSFYAPFLVISLARSLKHLGEAPLIVMQAVMVAVMATVLSVVPLDLNPQPTGPRADIGTLGDSLAFRPATLTLASERGAIRLDQYRFIADPSAQAITFEFHWSGIRPTERPYQFELIARAENSIDGEIIADPFRWYAQAGGYLPTCWREGDQIRDVIVLPLPPVSMPVVWEVTLRAIDERTGAILRVGENDQILLDPIAYP
ncbi:MAG: hypothetical protein MUF87_10585 [Anaerolineae bacterium]|nr:hypothetical protein [Anaerolineae bacterium]